MKPSTIAIHVGNEPEALTGAVSSPIYQTSNFAPGAKNAEVYEYTRAGNPNFTRLEQTLAALEDGKYSTVFGSGLGAFTALFSMLLPGDHVIASEDLYGGTVRLFAALFERFQVSVTSVPAPDVNAWKKAMNDKTRLIIIESPTNPLLQVVDIAAITSEANDRNIITVVDNTFATPIFQKPLILGANLSLHSTTKYIGGHSDIVGGAIITNNDELKQKLDFARKALGLNPSPFDCWLASRGLKTLALRMEWHQSNAAKLAKWLKTHPAVKDVLYPGFGGMVSIRLKMGREKAQYGFSKLRFFIRAESLGGVESLISHPATQTHASLTPIQRESRGIGDNLWRLSVGIEDVDDLQNDLENALNRMI